MIKVGCCGFPEAQRQYFSQFKLVEVQQTFYKPPQLETVLKWREQAPAGFEFSVKAWQLITHPPSSPTYRRAGLRLPAGKEDHYGLFKPTDEVIEAWHKTKLIAEVLNAKVILFQCPPCFVENEENINRLREFFQLLDNRHFLFAWEPRGEWSDKTIRTLCRDLDLTHCVDPLEAASLYGKVKYFRLHGGRGYRHSYSDEELLQVQKMLTEECYLLFNNITMLADALRFMGFLAKSDA